MKGNWRETRVLITGVCGTIGRELLHQAVDAGAIEVVGLDNNESDLFFLAEEYRHQPRVRLYLCDMRDRDEVARRMSHMNIVLHAAALKHVILCERSPRDALQTNIIGTQNVVDAANLTGVSRVVFTSSDKAVNPTNVMGTSKLMGERLITAANAQRRGNGTIFSSTRFGNVLGSRGSVVPLFRKQIEAGGPVTLTDRRMTRFIMTLQEAVRLVMESVFLARGGEVFVTKMPIARIEDLATVMIEELAPQFGHDPLCIQVETIGNKPGEKLFEELMNSEETRRTVELERYFVVTPAFTNLYESMDYTYPGMLRGTVEEPYNSELGTSMKREVLREYLIANRLLA